MLEQALTVVFCASPPISSHVLLTTDVVDQLLHKLCEFRLRFRISSMQKSSKAFLKHATNISVRKKRTGKYVLRKSGANTNTVTVHAIHNRHDTNGCFQYALKKDHSNMTIQYHICKATHNFRTCCSSSRCNHNTSLATVTVRCSS